MIIKNLIQGLKKFNEDANLYFTLDPNSNEGYPKIELIELTKYLVMGILSKPEEKE